jgi:hypothetical protein
MKKKSDNSIASIEKAISEKYGAETVQNPHGNWDEIKEKEYLQQIQELYKKTKRIEEAQEKIDVNGIKVSKKLFNRDAAQYCPVCSSPIRKVQDDVCLIKFKCCSTCYIKYIEGREERWFNGWRPTTKEEI